MTVNTTLHKVKYGNKTAIYRDLTVLELSYFSNIKNEVVRKEMVAKACIIDPMNGENIPWPILQQIGNSAIEQSQKWTSDKQLFEILVKQFRESISQGDTTYGMIRKIVEVFPGQSITDLLNLTWKDLVELVCLAEDMCGKRIFNVGAIPTVKRRGVKLASVQDSNYDEASLQRKMDELNAALGGVPK